MSSFAITTAIQKVILDKSGAAQVPFTVTNTSGQELRARMLTKPLAPASSEWLSVIGDSLRDFTAGTTAHVIVRVHVPSQTPPESYSFRLVVVAEAAPEEDVTESQVVAFDVAAPRSKRRFPWRIVAAVALVGVTGRRAARRRRVAAERARRLLRTIWRFVDQKGRPIIRRVPGGMKWK